MNPDADLNPNVDLNPDADLNADAAQRAEQRSETRHRRQQDAPTERTDLVPDQPLREPDDVEVPASDTLQQTLRTFGERCGFPAYYGANLDALLDCLRDQPSLHVTLTGAEVLRCGDPDGYARLVAVLRQARADSDDFHFAITR